MFYVYTHALDMVCMLSCVYSTPVGSYDASLQHRTAVFSTRLEDGLVSCGFPRFSTAVN